MQPQSQNQPDSQAAAEPEPRPLTLLRVPLSLCLSHEVPGCCPPAHFSPALRAVFGSDETWEIKLAAALVWSCRLHSACLLGRVADEDSDRGDRGGISADHQPSARQLGVGVVGPELRRFADFWRRYRALLPPPERQASLLFFDEEELRELQDAPLAAAARAWQSAVLAAHGRWVAAPAFRAEVGAVSLREWLGAVGCVESRAFGFRAPDGSELHAYVPFFCCANYQPGAPTMHLLRLEQGTEHGAREAQDHTQQPEQPEPETEECGGAAAEPSPQRAPTSTGLGCGPRAGETCPMEGPDAWRSMVDMVALSPPYPPALPSPSPSPAPTPAPAPFPAGRVVEARGRQEAGQGQGLGAGLDARSLPTSPLLPSPSPPQQQVYIDYGRKDTRSLVEQYGFVLYGNPYDRLDWEGLQLDAGCRMRRDWVHRAAEQLAEEAEAGVVTVMAEAEAHAPAEAVTCDAICAEEAGEAMQRRRREMPASGAGAASAAARGMARVCDDAPLLLPELGAQGGAAAARARLRSAAASVVDAAGWRNLRERRGVTPRSEARAVATLAGWVESRLSGFPTSAQQDAQLLLRLSSGRQSGRHHDDVDGAGEGGGGEKGCTAGKGGKEGIAVARAAGGERACQGGGGEEEAEAVDVACGAHAAAAQCRWREAVGACTARRRLAVSYRLEQKLLLLAARRLLQRLAAGGDAARTG